MEKLPKFNIEAKINSSNQYLASVTISPLSQGLGTTIGNSLRRVLLSFVPGAAVFAAKINSLSHEFTAIDGVMEDVTKIILNIKSLVIQIDEELFNVDELREKTISEWPSLKVKRNTKGIIYAKDIECPAGVKIINGDLKICELTEDVEFDMELYATVDTGYRSFIENRELLNTLKIIAIDSMFSPVEKVEWKVTEEKTTKQGTTDKLQMTIATNGSIKAIDALSYASRTLISLLEPIAQFNPNIAKKKLISDEETLVKKTVMATSIDDLGLTMRSFNCLKQNGINTIPELTNITQEEAEKIKNLGRKSLNEIISKLAERGLKFKD